MARLIPLHELAQTHNLDLGADAYDPTGQSAYASDGKKLGTVRGAMVDSATGKLRSLIVDVSGWFSDKQVVVPVGLARIEDDGVHFDSLTQRQVGDMTEYRAGMDYADTTEQSDERVLRGGAYSNAQDTTTDKDLTVLGRADATSQDTVQSPAQSVRPGPSPAALYQAPDRLRLLEERLLVNKERFIAGSVEIGKHVENRQEQVSVNLAHEELVIERRPVADPRPVEGNVTLGSDTQTVQVDLQAERANVSKQAYVTEEVSVGERTVTEQQTFTETVGKEVLDVSKTGEVRGLSDAAEPGDAATRLNDR